MSLLYGWLVGWLVGWSQGPTKFFAAYKQISLIGSVPTKFTVNSTTNWVLCLQAALACQPTLSGPETGRVACRLVFALL